MVTSYRLGKQVPKQANSVYNINYSFTTPITGEIVPCAGLFNTTCKKPSLLLHLVGNLTGTLVGDSRLDLEEEEVLLAVESRLALLLMVNPPGVTLIMTDCAMRAAGSTLLAV